MDPMSGRFVEEERAEQWMARVEVGEVVKIKGEELEIVKIEGREMTLKLLSAEDRGRRAIGDAFEGLDAMRESAREHNIEGLFPGQKGRKRDVPRGNRARR